MSRNTRYNKKLTKITNINEDCSEVSYAEDQYELGESDDYSKDSESTETAEMEGSSDSEEENLFNIRRNKKRRRIISSSDTEDERTSIPSTSRDVMEEIEIAVDGTRAFELIIDAHIMKHIKDCTETEARRVLKVDWRITVSELRSFLAILYARGANEVRALKVSYLWSKKWGPSFFRDTMTRDRFMQILRFIRFDKRIERSERLQTDKFALISEV
ncbi:uncharacterized protein LOC131673786 [Phymastichus coffea]|uniref:uncharacterized protein LOC131673786 n=1 Tax=Phymastichus coffea TaxID=108790 RepID=UPI00273C3FA5|nr:uncharacterized protein LOC131673786 [Phymastichus coffea]